MDEGLLFDPGKYWTIDCYPDADFAELWGHDHPQDPHYTSLDISQRNWKLMN